MDEFSQKKLDELKLKDKSLLTPDDIAFLKARSSYLTSEEVESLIPVDEPVVVEKPLSQKNKAELLAMCAEKGIEVPEGATNEQIRELLK